jgi:hypothetical protein
MAANRVLQFQTVLFLLFTFAIFKPEVALLPYSVRVFPFTLQSMWYEKEMKSTADAH